MVGAITPYFRRASKASFNLPVIPVAPLAREDWFLNPEIYVDLDASGWFFKGNTNEPSPGMSSAIFGTPPWSGHCGILDYDGSWINAGKININKSIHLSDSTNDYKPANFRSR